MKIDQNQPLGCEPAEAGDSLAGRGQLEKDLRRRADELAALHTVSLHITKAQDLPTLLHTITSQAIRLLNSSGGSFYLCDRERQTAYCAVSYHDTRDYTGITLKYGEGVTGIVALTGEPLLIADYRTWPGRALIFENDTPVRALLGVPVIWQGQVTGVINVFLHRDNRRFNRTEQELLTLFASQAAIAIENARLLQSERQRRQEAENLRQATATLTSSLDLNTVLDNILLHLERVVPYDSASLLLLEGNHLHGMAGRGFPSLEAVVGQDFPAENALAIEIFNTRRPLIIGDTQRDPRFERWGNTSYARSWMGVPLITHGEVIGYLTCDNREVDAYQDADARLAEAFGNHAAVAIENARLFAAERAQLLLAQTLQAVGALLTTQLGLDEVLENILDLMGRVVKYDSASVQLVDREGRLYLAAGRGFPDFQAAFQAVRDLSDHMLQTQWVDNRVSVIPDTYAYEHWRVAPSTEYIRSWVSGPLLVKGRFIGSLNVDSRTINAFNQATGETVMAIANQAAIAIENARLFEAEHCARERAEALREAARVIGSTLSTGEVLQAILDQIARVLPYESGNVVLVERDRLVTKAWRGYEAFTDPELAGTLIYDLKAAQAAGEIMRSGEPLVIQDVQNDPRWSPTSINRHIRSWLGVPLRIRDQVVGLFNLNRVTPEGFSAEEVGLAQTFALHASTAIENAYLYEAEGKRAAELEAVRQVSLSLTASLELHQVLDTILKSTLNLLPEADNSHIFLYDSGGGGRLTFSAALWQEDSQKLPWSAPRTAGLTYTVARTGETIVVENMASHPLYADINPKWTGAIVGLPLKIRQRVAGVMNIAYRQSRTFTEVELRVLRLLGDQAAIAIENARLFEQAATERRHLALLYDISRELVSTLDPDEMLGRATTLICQAMGGLFCEAFLYLPDEDRLSLRALYGGDHDSLAVLEKHLNNLLETRITDWMAQNRQAVNIADVTQDPRWLHVSGLDEEVQSALIVPIHQGEHLLGMLSVLHREEAAFSAEHLALVETICQEIGLALSNASRYQEVQRRLAEITLIQSLTQTFSQRLELQVLLDEVVMQLGQRLGYPRADIFLIHGDDLILRASHCASHPLQRLPIQKGILGRVVRTHQAVLLLDANQDPDYIRCNESICSQLAVPILRGTEIIGVMNIQADQPDFLKEQDRDLLLVLAGQISVAIENAVLFERVLTYAEDLEHKVEQRTAELSELYKLSQEIGYKLSYEELLGLLLRHLRPAVRCEVAIGCLTNHDFRVLTIDTGRPIAPAALDLLHAYCIDSLVKNVQGLLNPDQISIEIIPGDDFKETDAPIVRLASLIHAPIFIEQRLVGLLIAGSEIENAFGSEQERLLTTFSNQAATAAQRLDAVLAAQQKHLESLVEHMPVGTLLLDSDFNLLVSNPIGQEILSVLNEGIADKILDRLGAFSLQELLTHQNDLVPVEIIHEGPPRRIFTAQIRPVGEAPPEAMPAVDPCIPPGGVFREKRQWVLTVREVTQESENQARIQGQERLATVGQLAAGIAHDFNNIMAAILVYTDLLRNNNNMPAACQDKLNIIQQQVQRAASLIRQILDFSRRSVMDQSALDLLPFVKELDRLLARVLPETIRLELMYQPGIFCVNADPTRIQQVFMNLVLNARDAMPEGGILRVGLDRLKLEPGDISPYPNMPPGGWICISVTDTGTGIPAEVQKHIFEPFYTTKPVGQGTGLGLAQVYGIIKKHDGYITVQSEEGAGTSFCLYLPELPASLYSKGESEILHQLNGQGQTALVVEDDQVTLEALRTLLEEHNFNVLTAANGIEALQQFDQARKPVNLVISDIVMPHMGGVQLYLALMKRRLETHMLFITGHPLEEESQALLQKGNVHWLQKPFSVQDFNHAVLDLLSDCGMGE